MMYVDPSSQFKYVAKSTSNVPSSEATSTNTATENPTVSTTENIASSVAQVPPNAATHFQAPEHIQKQSALAQNAGNTTVPISPGQIVPAAGQIAQPAGVAGVPGLTYDGKRMRKTMQRRTVDYNSSVIRFLETRKWFKCSRNQHALQPQEIYNLDVVPPCGYIKNPINAVTTKFVRTSTNKLRCPIFCVVWTPEGRRLVTGASSGEFTLWNGLTFNFETILQAHDRAVRSMVWSHNDLWLLTGDHGGFVKYWQSNMNNVKMYEAHKEPVRGLSFSPSDNKFASCSDDGLVKVWDFYRCAEERELKGHGADVKCVDWHPTKGLLVSGSKDSQQPVKLWDPKSGNSITTLHCHKSTVMAAKWNSNGNWLVTGSRDHLLKLFDIRMMKELQTFRGHKKEATVVAWHPVHETLFASGGSDGSLMFWLTGVDEKAGGMEKAHEGIVWSLSWHPLGHILCSGSNDHTSKFWARNRPGDAMTDKYNLDIQGSQEDGEYGEEGTNQTSVPALAAYDASQIIPGVGRPVAASNVILPDSKDVDAHLYGAPSTDNRKAAVIKPSATGSSDFPYPPAYKQTTTLGNRSIPGLDMSNTSGQMKQEQDGYNIPHAPKLRLPTHPQSNPANQLPQGSHALPGNPPPVAGYPGNRPPFVPGQRHSFDYRGPLGPRGADSNIGSTNQFQQNQFMRFPGPHGPGGPRGNFVPQGGPGGPHNEPWRAPHHRGPRGTPYRTPDGQHGGARPQNTSPDQYRYRGNYQEGVRPLLDPMNPLRGPRQQDTSQLVPGDSLQGALHPRAPITDSNVRSDMRPPLKKPPGQHGPIDSMQGDPSLHRPSNEYNVQSGGFFRQDGLQDESHCGPAGLHSSSRSGTQTENVPSVQHGPGDDPPGPNIRLDSSLHGGPRPLLSVPSSPRGSTEHGPGGINVHPDSPHAGSRPLFNQYGPRDISQGPPTAASNVHPSGSHRGPRPSLNVPPGPYGPRDGSRGLRARPPSPRDGPNFGSRAMNDNGHPFGSRGPRPPHFEQPRLDHSKPDLKSPEAEKRGTSEARENILRKSRDDSPRDSPPVSASNHAKQERRSSDPSAPGILGDYVTHMQEMQRGMLENIAGSAVGRLFGQPEIARTDRPPHGRTDTDRGVGTDTARTNSRTGERSRTEGERRGDRQPSDLSVHHPPRDRPGDRDRLEIGRREDLPHDRSAKNRQKDRPSFEGRPGDRPSRGNSQERHDAGQPVGRFECQDTGRQSDESDLPAHEKPGLLPIPDMFLPRGPLAHEGPPLDAGSGANHHPPDRRRDHNRFQDGRNDIRSDNPAFVRGPRDRNPLEMGQNNPKLGVSHTAGLATGETNAVKPLMSLLDAPPVGLGSPPGQGGMENRGRKRSMEHEFDRPPKRMGAGDKRERPR